MTDTNMIICIKVRNFFSMREDAVLDFTAEHASRKKTDVLPENIIQFKGDNFVNIIGLFGGNAAGKSNIIKAIDFCRRLILKSHLNNEGDPFDYEPFKFAPGKPSEFYIDFVADNVEYEYSFALLKDRIISESLYYYPNKRRSKIFIRENGDSYSYGKGLIPKPTEIEASTGSNTLFLSRASSMNREIARIVYKFFLDHVITELGSLNLADIPQESFDAHKQMLLKALEVSDSDIIDIQWETPIQGSPRLRSFHRENPSMPFDFEKEESEGTKRLLYILLLILQKLPEGCAIFLDEFDIKLHLYLAQFILDVVRASKCMQLVFTSHNPELINTSLLRPEQIVFVNKQQDGNSELIPLSDYEDINKIGDVKKAYLQGRFDGIPYIGNPYPLISEILSKR